MKMNPEWKAKWLAALRSGDYEQGSTVLKRGGNFCCLGVACDISGLGSWDDRNDGDPGACSHWLDLGAEPDDYTAAKLPDPVAEMFGLVGLGGFVYLPEIGSLTALNDSGKTFAEIADIIEEHL